MQLLLVVGADAGNCGLQLNEVVGICQRDNVREQFPDDVVLMLIVHQHYCSHDIVASCLERFSSLEASETCAHFASLQCE